MNHRAVSWLAAAAAATQPAGQAGFFSSRRTFTPSVSGAFYVRAQARSGGGAGCDTVRVQ
ncbi:MAG: hypothetical protein JNK82_23515 [Myxococcaceae bacterium]|nr:hypothetical protein [Myxococcaceae bacterium]